MTVYNTIKAVSPSRASGYVALGLFDGLHPGHQAVISAAVEEAKQVGGESWVFTFTMNRVQPAGKAAAGRLITPSARDRMLEEMGVSHLLCPPFEEFCDLAPEEYVKELLQERLNARTVFCGENYHFGKNAAGTAADLQVLGERYGMEVCFLPMILRDGAPVNSTRIRNCVQEGDMAAARRLLGRPFSVDFEVIPGRKLGRTLRFPTINQPFPEDFVRPRFGVYASHTTIAGKQYRSVSNVGVKPTVGADQLLAETCIFGYEGDLYGQRIPVELLAFLRPERKFGNVEALQGQIEEDVRIAKEVLADLESEGVGECR